MPPLTRTCLACLLLTLGAGCGGSDDGLTVDAHDAAPFPFDTSPSPLPPADAGNTGNPDSGGAESDGSVVDPTPDAGSADSAATRGGEDAGGGEDGGALDPNVAPGRQLRSLAVGASGARGLAGRAHDHPARAARRAERLPRRILLHRPHRRLDDLLGPRERRDHRQLRLPSLRAPRDDRGRRGGELGADRHEHAERDAQGDADPRPRRRRADPPRNGNAGVDEAAPRALLLRHGRHRHRHRADAGGRQRGRAPGRATSPSGPSGAT